MAPPTDPGGSFSINRDGKSFFDVLPRELRDNIYQCTFDHDSSNGYYRYQFRAPQPHLRLVSRQFMHEYDEQTPDKATLFVTACTNQFQRNYFDYSNGFPRSATRCTAADVTLYIAETDGFADDLRDERYYVQDLVSEHLGNIHGFFDRLPRLQSIRAQLNLNFAQSFDMVHQHMDICLDTFRHYYEEPSPERSYLPDITVELGHLELSYPDLPSCLTSNIPDSEILERPAILAKFWLTYGHARKKVRHDDEVKRRIHVEAAVLAAWEAQQGCTMSESAKKAAGIVDEILDREGSWSP